MELAAATRSASAEKHGGVVVKLILHENINYKNKGLNSIRKQQLE